MIIDTLNAHCGHWLVHCPCLAQGRFCIPPERFLSGTGLSPLLWGGVASSFERVQLVGGHDSWDSLPGQVPSDVLVVRLAACLWLLAPLCFST